VGSSGTAYQLISNRYDAPEEVAAAYVKRCRIEVFTILT
jgi:hypothetical protein